VSISTPPIPEIDETYAAVDLGSNSFHLLVARRTHGELRVLDRIKEMVRLGGGLDAEGRLDDATRMRAMDCLARFGQRLGGIPDANMRAVGTQAFRRMRAANSFLMVTETALGCPVDIIAGREEARLIYLGVSQDIAGHPDRRLVIDIGGGSTEIVRGTGITPTLLESMQFGCVSVTRRFFPNGQLAPQAWQQAVIAVRAELQELQTRYREAGWDRAIGSSGTLRAAESMCRAAGWTEKHITTEALGKLSAELLSQKQISRISIPGLSERRRPVIAGGVVILQACFEALDIEQIEVSRFALREGVLHDLLGRLEHKDPRYSTVEAFMSRFGVDTAQSERVGRVALDAFDQLAQDASLTHVHRELLKWAADLHETGLDISHSHYQRHSGYLVEESDMAGFSCQEQQFLAALVRFHRRAVPADFVHDLPARLQDPLRFVLFCLRLAWILCRTREDATLPDFSLKMRDHAVNAGFPHKWLAAHPLTCADLEQEISLLQPIGMVFSISES